MTGLDVLQTVHYMKDWTFYDPLTREDTEFAVV